MSKYRISAGWLALPIEPIAFRPVWSQRIAFGKLERLYKFAMLQFLVSLTSPALHDTPKLFGETKK